MVVLIVYRSEAREWLVFSSMDVAQGDGWEVELEELDA